MMHSASLAVNTGQEKQDLPTIMSKPMQPKPIQPKSLRILLAEDNFFDQQIARKMFKMLGHQVDIVKNGIEALDAAERKAYDLIVMDIQMPLMNGIEAAKCIRKSQGNALKIIFVTSSEPSIYRDLFFEAGGNEFLTKPLTVSKLDAAMKQV
jgi:CheY-like chemotaxis protein